MVKYNKIIFIKLVQNVIEYIYIYMLLGKKKSPIEKQIYFIVIIKMKLAACT